MTILQEFVKGLKKILWTDRERMSKDSIFKRRLLKLIQQLLKPYMLFVAVFFVSGQLRRELIHQLRRWTLLRSRFSLAERGECFVRVFPMILRYHVREHVWKKQELT